MGQLAETLVQALLPARCLLCGESLPAKAPGGVCQPCWQSLPRLQGPRCQRCGESSLLSPCLACRTTPPPWEGLVAAFPYQDQVKELILALKSGQDLLARPLAQALWSALAGNLPSGEWFVTFVPMRPWRRLRRGFNQAELLARPLARWAGWPCGGLLQRKAAGSQRGLSRSQRKAQVAHAFRAHRPVPPQVLLVDDVVTTGATAAAATSALHRGGGQRVWVAAVARTLRKG